MQKFLPLLLFCAALNSTAQTLNVFSDGADVSINDAEVIIDGDVFLQGNGTFDNSGHLHVNGDWTNNNSNNVFTPGLGGWTHFSGANQNISGTDFTLFNKLELAGSGIKQLIGVNAEIEDTLALNDVEFSAGNNTVFVLNSDAGAVTRDNTSMSGGFVSSDNDGGLSRAAASVDSYIFPVGSSIGTVRYRPVDISPISAASTAYKVRMANENPNIVIGNSINPNDSICEINPNYYHRIYGSNAADISVYYDAASDGNFQTTAHYDGVSSEWKNTLNNSSVTNPPLTGFKKSNWSNWNNPLPDHFALARMTPVASITQTVSSCSGSDALFAAIPGGFANYEFFVNGISVQAGTDSIYASGNINNGDTIKVVLYDVPACKSINNTGVSATVFPSPDVLINGKDTINIGQSDTLAANGAFTYFWQNNSVTDSTIIVSPTEETIYMVIGTDANGCIDTATITVYVDANCVHWLPNIFSPNTDGENDEFKIYGRGLEWTYLTIYDRWGNRVFESDDATMGWNGKMRGSGNMLNNGVFVYILKGKCITSGEEFEQSGNVTLSR